MLASSPISSPSPPEELWLKVLSRAVSEVVDSDPAEGEPWWASLKIWMVSVDDDTQSNVDVVLKDML